MTKAVNPFKGWYWASLFAVAWLSACGSGDSGAMSGAGGSTTLGRGGESGAVGQGGSQASGVGGMMHGAGGAMSGEGGMDMSMGGGMHAGSGGASSGLAGQNGRGGTTAGSGGSTAGSSGTLPGSGGTPTGSGGMTSGSGGSAGRDAGGSDAGPACHAGGTLQVGNTSMTAYVVDGASNPTLTFCRGTTYVFAVNAPGHPFYIKTVKGTGTANTYSAGVTGNGTMSGNVTFVVPSDAPDTLYYQCSLHTLMVGTINIVGP